MNKLNAATDLSASLRKKVISTGDPDELKIDPHYEADPMAAKIVEYGIKRGKNILIYGPTGCGKSTLLFHVLAKLKLRGEVFNCDVNTSTDDLIAKMMITTDNGQSVTSVSLGAALRAYKEGWSVILEEIDHAAADILAGMHRIMEINQDFYTLNVGAKEVITKAKGFNVMATANTIGTGEDTYMYAGTKPLNMAFMNRFSICVKLGYLPKDKEITVVKAKTGVRADIAEQLVLAANDARDAADPTRINGAPGSSRIASTISTRDLLEWADMIVGMSLGPKEAAKYAFLNRINEADRDIVSTFVENRCTH